MNLCKLTDDQLHLSAISAAKREREETLNVLRHLAEVERRRLYSKFACDSLHAYCTKYLKMSDGQAGRHVGASRLMTELPVIQEKVLEGSMNFTTVCQASSFFKKEASAGNRFDREEKLELISQIEDQSTRNVEQILLSHSSNLELHLRESVKQKTRELTEIKIIVDEETYQRLERLKEIWSHEMPGATYGQLLSTMAKLSLSKCDPDEKAARSTERAEKRQGAINSEIPAPLTPAPECDSTNKVELKPQVETHFSTPKRSRRIPAAIRHAVYLRDNGQCTFVDSEGGRRCDSKHLVEMDHIDPYAFGGEHTIDNLRLRCRAHNQRHAIDTFGAEVTDRYQARGKAQ